MLVAADYAQLEFRAAAFQADCPVAKQAIMEGLDVHALTTQKIFNKLPEDADFKKYRQKAKAFTFKPLYGGLTGTPTQQAYFKAFLEQYRGVAAWQQRIMAEIKMTGKWKCPYTGKVFKYNTNFYYETKAKNYPVQYFAAVITQAAMIGIYNKIKDIDGIDMILQIHDAIVLDCEEKLLDTACTIMYTEMVGVNRTLLKYFGFEIALPMGVELTSGPTYYDQKEMIEENGIWIFKQ